MKNAEAPLAKTNRLFQASLVFVLLGIVLLASLAGWVVFLGIRVNSFPRITEKDVPGLYLANHGGLPDRMMIRPNGTFVLQYKESSWRAITVSGSWKFDDAHGPEIWFANLAPGRNADSSRFGSWPQENHRSLFGVGLFRNKLSGHIYIELYPDLNDYYEKQYDK